MQEQSTTEEQTLKRVLTLPLITLYGTGGIIGAGIYVLIGKIAGVAGLLAPFSFVIAASIALFSALTYSELSSRFPSSGGEVTFVQRGFEFNQLSLIVGLAICFGGIVSSAAIALGAAGYLRLYIDIPTWQMVTFFILLISALACWGVLESVGVAAAITLIEIGGLIVVCVIGAPNLDALADYQGEMIPQLAWSDWSVIFSAAILAFYAYIGFEDMVNMGEEVKNPQGTMPIAILLALVISTVLYIVVALVFIASVPLDVLATTEAPFAEIVRRNSSLPTSFINVISLLAITNGVLVQIIMSARILFGMSNQQLLPGFFGRVNTLTRTPVYATLAVAAVVLLFALLLPIESLARLTSYILLSVFSLVNLALMRIKWRDRKAGTASEAGVSGVFTVPFGIPVAGFLLCVGFLLVQIV